MRFRMIRSIAIAGGTEVLGGSDSLTHQMNEVAFRDLYQESAPRLRSYLRRACGDAALADDLLQETFLKLLRTKLPSAVMAPPDGDRQLRAYLYRMATNLLTDHWRRVKRERRWSLLELFRREPSQPAIESLDSLGGDTARGFDELKPQEQALLWLAYVEGFDHSEIAAALELGEASIRVLLFRARRKLADILKKRGEKSV